MTVILVMFIQLTTFAQTVSPEDASARAKEFFSTQTDHSGRKFMSRPLQLAYTASRLGETHFYVFNRIGGGWVIVGGDEVSSQILGYSDEGCFDMSNINDNARAWLASYEDQISEGIAQTTTSTGSRQVPNRRFVKAKSALGSAIAPLIQTQWGQFAPFYNLNPVIEGSHALTGCVATAMAQIMNYYQWPASGTGSHSYYHSATAATYSADFAARDYDWTSVHDKVLSAGFNTPELKSEIARIFNDISISVDMNFGKNGSGALSNSPSVALPKYFQYDPGIQYVQKTGYIGDWDDMLYSELAASRPIIYGGVDTEGGHEFICDGYKYEGEQNMFHFNWGWNGDFDGYFLTSALNPNIYKFNSNQHIIIGIKPLKPGHLLSVVIKDTDPATTINTTKLGGHLQLPDRLDTGLPFLGWTTANLTSPTSDVPTYHEAGWFTPTSDMSLYPVFSYSSNNKGVPAVVFYEDFSCLPATEPTIITGYFNGWLEDSKMNATNICYINGMVVLGYSSAGALTTTPIPVKAGETVAVTFGIQCYSTPNPLSVSISGGETKTVSDYTSRWGYSEPLSEVTVSFTAPTDNPTITFSSHELVSGEIICIDNIEISAPGNTTYFVTSATPFTAPLTITDAKWGTFYAPADVTLEAGVYAYAVTSDGSNLQRVLVASGDDSRNNIIPAYTPVIVYKNVSSTYTKNYSGTFSSKVVSPIVGNLLKGTFCNNSQLSPDDSGVTNYVLQKNGTRADWFSVVYDEGTSKFNQLSAFRAYLSTDLSSSVKSLLDFDPVTGISEIGDEERETRRGTFTLSGQKVDGSYRGIVIRNGKKYLIK